MNLSLLSQIKGIFDILSIPEQLLLIEQFVHQVHQRTLKKEDINDQPALMADDPEIQNELNKIEQEFAVTEGDGLESVCKRLAVLTKIQNGKYACRPASGNLLPSDSFAARKHEEKKWEGRFVSDHPHRWNPCNFRSS